MSKRTVLVRTAALVLATTGTIAGADAAPHVSIGIGCPQIVLYNAGLAAGRREPVKVTVFVNGEKRETDQGVVGSTPTILRFRVRPEEGAAGAKVRAIVDYGEGPAKRTVVVRKTLMFRSTENFLQPYDVPCSDGLQK